MLGLKHVVDHKLLVMQGLDCRQLLVLDHPEHQRAIHAVQTCLSFLLAQSSLHVGERFPNQLVQACLLLQFVEKRFRELLLFNVQYRLLPALEALLFEGLVKLPIKLGLHLPG